MLGGKLVKTLDWDELTGQREGEARGAEAERRWQRVAGMVMGRCTQARFQLHAAHVTSCTHGLHTHPCQHTEHTAHTLGILQRSSPQTHVLR